MFEIQILNSFRGDDIKAIDTSTDDGREQAAKLLAELIKSGSAVFLEREIDGETRTYRVTGYDPATDRINITLPLADLERDSRKDEMLAAAPLKAGRGRPRRHTVEASMPSTSGRAVSVAPVSGGVDEVAPAAPPELSWEAVRWGMDRLCAERGWHHGCPMPSATVPSQRLMVAKGAPLDHHALGILNFGLTEPSVHVCSVEDVDECPPVKKAVWNVAPRRVEIYRDGKGSFKVQWPIIHERMKMMMDTMMVRSGAMNWETELTAMRSLQEKITDGQWGSYILSGMFPEKSERSGVTYILRKGLPTIAMTDRPLPDGRVQRKFLAALCLHPLAWYLDTWCGSQPPSDEVIGHLMMIRSDEHRFWKKSGQHPIDAPQAGI
jgi:hypothetical protein